jgi:hypothetical protein
MRISNLCHVAPAIAAWSEGKTWISDVEDLLNVETGTLRRPLELGGICTSGGKVLPSFSPECAVISLMLILVSISGSPRTKRTRMNTQADRVR